MFRLPGTGHEVFLIGHKLILKNSGGGGARVMRAAVCKYAVLYL